MALFRLDDYIAESRHEPYELDCGDQGKFIIEYPDGETLAQLSETPLNQTRRIVQLLVGDDEEFEKIWAILAPLPGDVMAKIANAIVVHFKLNELATLPGGRKASRR